MKMDVLEAIHSRSSVRVYRKEPVAIDLIRQVIQAAARAASASNAQPWRFIVVGDKNRQHAIRAIAPGIRDEPAAIVAVCLQAPGAGNAHADEMAWMSLGAALQNLLLAAHALGLGACPVGSFHQRAVALLLDLPAGVTPAILVTLGYPIAGAAASKKPAPQKGLDEICFSERWGVPL
jgi:nitroreductase